MNLQVQFPTFSKLLLLDGYTFERFLFFPIPFNRQVHSFVGTRFGKEIILPRPYLHDFLQFCMEEGFHIVLLNCKKTTRDPSFVKALWNDKLVTCVKWIETNKLFCNTFKGIILEQLLPMYLKDFIQDNVIVLDVLPHRTYFNPFYSSLYPTAFSGELRDDFLKTEFIPYLQILASSPSSARSTIKRYYPTWSSTNLKLDWKVNHQIWKSDDVLQYATSGHLSRFRERKPF